MTLERWQIFTKHDQMLHIGAAVIRASTAQENDTKSFAFFINEALNLVELTLKDPKWQVQIHGLYGLRQELNKFLSGERKENIEILYQAL